MQNGPKFTADKTQRLVWWVIWAAVLGWLVAVYFFLGRGPMETAEDGDVRFNLVALVPLFVSIVIRWRVLPRYTEARKALPIFIVGLVLAEICGFLGIFLGGPYRDDLFVLAVLGVLQFIPLFAGGIASPGNRDFRGRP